MAWAVAAQERLWVLAKAKQAGRWNEQLRLAPRRAFRPSFLSASLGTRRRPAWAPERESGAGDLQGAKSAALPCGAKPERSRGWSPWCARGSGGCLSARENPPRFLPVLPGEAVHGFLQQDRLHGHFALHGPLLAPAGWGLRAWETRPTAADRQAAKRREPVTVLVLFAEGGRARNRPRRPSPRARHGCLALRQRTGAPWARRQTAAAALESARGRRRGPKGWRGNRSMGTLHRFCLIPRPIRDTSAAGPG
jgi:hypothetical protein